MANIAIVVAAYDRDRSLSRLLGSLAQVDFDGQAVPLILSLDRSDNPEVTRVAEAFVWSHGEKRLRTFPQRQGLKQHILACGALTREFEHVIVLEDDLYVSKNLFRYATQAAEFYSGDDRVAGIALYSHLWNVGCSRPFQPIHDACDAFFIQYACSWGQVWSRRKWEAFINWLEQNDVDFGPDTNIPGNVSQWSSRSWLKHHIRYCIATDRYFVYPRVALSTNFNDAGEHVRGHNGGFQVPLQEAYVGRYSFPALGHSGATYDAFFESRELAEVLGLPAEDLCVDLYGMKGNSSGRRYWLTQEGADFKVLGSFDLSLRPHEANVTHKIPGNSIKLYDTSVVAAGGRRSSASTQDQQVRYDIRGIPYQRLIALALREVRQRLIAKIGLGRGAG